MSHNDDPEIFEDVLSARVRAPDGNVKIIYPPVNGGSHKIVWAWACGTTGILVAMVGVVALYFAGQQTETNQRVADALTNLAVKVGQLETKIDSLEDQ